MLWRAAASGSSLAKGVLEAIRAEGRTVVPQCEFIAGYLERHPEYQDLVAPRS